MILEKLVYDVHCTSYDDYDVFIIDLYLYLLFKLKYFYEWKDFYYTVY